MSFKVLSFFSLFDRVLCDKSVCANVTKLMLPTTFKHVNKKVAYLVKSFSSGKWKTCSFSLRKKFCLKKILW